MGFYNVAEVGLDAYNDLYRGAVNRLRLWRDYENIMVGFEMDKEYHLVSKNGEYILFDYNRIEDLKECLGIPWIIKTLVDIGIQKDEKPNIVKRYINPRIGKLVYAIRINPIYLEFYNSQIK